MDRQTLSLVLLNAGTVAIAFVIGANLFEQFIFVPGWQSPEGIEAWRLLTKQRHAGLFFLPLAVSSVVLFATGTGLGWKYSLERNPYALGATVAIFLALVLTGSYIAPRAYRLFAAMTSPADAARLLTQYQTANVLRLLLAFAGLVSGLCALRR